MAGQLTNDPYFTPDQYRVGWSHDVLAARYVDLYVQYCALRTQIEHASNARPLERERIIHNLQNARLRLEHENQRLQRQHQELGVALQTNRSVNEELQRRCVDTEETMRAVLEARSQNSADELRECKVMVAKLREENERLRGLIRGWDKLRDEGADGVEQLRRELEKSGLS